MIQQQGMMVDWETLRPFVDTRFLELTQQLCERFDGDLGREWLQHVYVLCEVLEHFLACARCPKNPSQSPLECPRCCTGMPGHIPCGTDGEQLDDYVERLTQQLALMERGKQLMKARGHGTKMLDVP